MPFFLRRLHLITIQGLIYTTGICKSVKVYLIKYVNSVRSVTKPTISKRGIQMGFVVVLLHMGFVVVLLLQTD